MLVQYHYLDRPYRLEALTATELPTPILLDENENLMSNPDDVLCIMPSDHWISDDTYYCNLVNSGIPEACKSKWVTFGVKICSG